MAPMISKRSPLYILLLLSVSVEYVHGFGGAEGAGLSLSSRPHGVSSLSLRTDRRANCSGLSVDADNERATTVPNHDRRSFLSSLATSSLAFGLPLYPTQNANAIPFFGGSGRRQLELCLVTILRTQYWATNTAGSLKSKLLSPAINTSDDSMYSEAEMKMAENAKKQPYLEARLGAKALLTQKIGGGATSRVRDLGAFQLKECLDDANYWCGELAKNNQLPSQQMGEMSTKQARRFCSNDLTSAAEDLVESLASLVEFDGLETTIDPSPRSSLMLSMYTPQKGTFVYRTLIERVVPSCERYSKLFGKERMSVIEEFVRKDYADEIPFEVLEKLYANQQM